MCMFLIFKYASITYVIRSGDWPQELINEAHALGLMNLHVPEFCGGAGLGCLENIIIAEELAYGCSGVMYAFYFLVIASLLIILKDCYDS